jgi:hypothetical protein
MLFSSPLQCEAGSGSSSVTRCGPAERLSDQSGAAYRPAISATTTQGYLGWRDETSEGGNVRLRLRIPSQLPYGLGRSAVTDCPRRYLSPIATTRLSRPSAERIFTAPKFRLTLQQGL